MSNVSILLCENIHLVLLVKQRVCLLSSDGRNTETSYNLALWKLTRQSSMLRSYASYKAVDGNSLTVLESGHCSVTTQSPGSWWQVDLEQEYNISEVIITSSLNGDGKVITKQSIQQLTRTCIQDLEMMTIYISLPLCQKLATGIRKSYTNGAVKLVNNYLLTRHFGNRQNSYFG